MSLFDDPERRDPRRRPPDPAGTRPLHAPEDLRPREAEPLLPPRPAPSPGPGTDGSVAAAGPGPSSPRPRAARFAFVTGALLAIGAAGVAVLVAVLVAGTGDDGTSARPARLADATWSSWRPPGATPEQQLSAIANHVGAEYKLPNGRQVVAVQSGPLQTEGQPLIVATRQPAAKGGAVEVKGSGGVLYTLCGLGDDCRIESGTPSIQRALLLHREALELALYTFRYAPGLPQVLVQMPPSKGGTKGVVLYFEAASLRAALDRPLTRTLAARAPNTRTMNASPDVGAVHRLTDRAMYTPSVRQAQGNYLLVLDAVTP